LWVPDIYSKCFNFHNTHQKSNWPTLFLYSEKQIILKNNNRSEISQRSEISLDTGSGVQDSTPARFRVFLKDPDADQEAKICEKPDQDPGHFSISAVAGGDFLSKNMGKLPLDR